MHGARQHEYLPAAIASSVGLRYRDISFETQTLAVPEACCHSSRAFRASPSPHRTALKPCGELAQEPAATATVTQHGRKPLILDARCESDEIPKL
jgi:hypothetical protein